MAFAEARGLPHCYVPYFVNAVLKGADDGADGHGEPGQGPVSSSSPAAPPLLRLRFRDFERFVASREAALKEAFHSLDYNGDGLLSLEDLQAGINSVCIGASSTVNPRYSDTTYYDLGPYWDRERKA